MDAIKNPAALSWQEEEIKGWNLGRGGASLAQTVLSCLAWVPARFLGGGKSFKWVQPQHLGSLVKGGVEMQR